MDQSRKIRQNANLLFDVIPFRLGFLLAFPTTFVSSVISDICRYWRLSLLKSVISNVSLILIFHYLPSSQTIVCLY